MPTRRRPPSPPPPPLPLSARRAWHVDPPLRSPSPAPLVAHAVVTPGVHTPSAINNTAALLVIAVDKHPPPPFPPKAAPSLYPPPGLSTRQPLPCLLIASHSLSSPHHLPPSASTPTPSLANGARCSTLAHQPPHAPEDDYPPPLSSA